MDSNPYAPPQAALDEPVDVVDREQRNDLAALVRSFLNEEISAFEFDERLNAFRASPDSAVRFVSFTVWYHYDDCDDHLVSMNKADWDYFQRLLLLLASDRGVNTAKRRHWSRTQLVALLALLACAWFGYQLGCGLQLLLALIPFGLVSIGISLWRCQQVEIGPYERILFPYATFAELESTYRSVEFKKTRYPRHIQSRPIRSPLKAKYHLIQFYVGWLILSPFALLCQLLPETEFKTRLVER